MTDTNTPIAVAHTAQFRNLRAQKQALLVEHNRQRNCPSRGYDEDAALAQMVTLDIQMNDELDALDRLTRPTEAVPPERETCEICDTPEMCLSGKCPCDLTNEFVFPVDATVANKMLSQIREAVPPAAGVVEALRLTQVMLEAIDRTNSTNFGEVRERIVANRAALASKPTEPEAPLAGGVAPRLAQPTPPGEAHPMSAIWSAAWHAWEADGHWAACEVLTALLAQPTPPAELVGAILDALHERLPYPTEACAIVRSVAANPPPELQPAPARGDLVAEVRAATITVDGVPADDLQERILAALNPAPAPSRGDLVEELLAFAVEMEEQDTDYTERHNRGAYLARRAAKALNPAPEPQPAPARGDLVEEMRRKAKDWRRPALRQIEGPNDLKIYGGTIADDIDRWADHIAALNPAPAEQAERVGGGEYPSIEGLARVLLEKFGVQLGYEEIDHWWIIASAAHAYMVKNISYVTSLTDARQSEGELERLRSLAKRAADKIDQLTGDVGSEDNDLADELRAALESRQTEGDVS